MGAIAKTQGSATVVDRILTKLTHESVRNDQLSAARHRGFFVMHMVGGLLALAALPLFIWLRGWPEPDVIAAFVLLIAPLLIAFLLSATGELDLCHALTVVDLAALVLLLTLLTGGFSSYLVAWFVIVPLEAALSQRRWVTYWAIGVMCLCLVALALATAFNLLPDPKLPEDMTMLFALGTSAAAVYASGILVSLQNLHRQAESTARRSAGRYRLMADNVMDLITRHSPDMRVTFASPAARSLLGRDPKELVGMDLEDLVHYDDRIRFRAALDQVFDDGQDAIVEFRMLSQEGAYRWVEMRCRPMFAPGMLDDPERRKALAPEGRYGAVAVTRDVSDRKKQERALLDARDAAESASRAKSRFLANMSHELRTPLNAIIGFSEMINTQTYGPIAEPRYVEYAGIVNQSGRDLLAIINDLLDMSRIEIGAYEISLETVPLADIVQASLNFVMADAQIKHITLESDVPDEGFGLIADTKAVKQILINLLSNAVKFSNEGGTVQLRVQARGDDILFEISDTGSGIEPGILSRLGQPFERAADERTSASGTGLGLAIVFAIARIHGGDVAIDSKVGQGTRVMVMLPKEGPNRGERPASDPISLAPSRPQPTLPAASTDARGVA